MSTRDTIQFTHWKRPTTRTYHYNHQVAESYYKPQVRYITDVTEKSRRNMVPPPGAQTFMERWTADPFYGKVDGVIHKRSRAASEPVDYYPYPEEDTSITPVQAIREQRRAESLSRERFVDTTSREECIAKAVGAATGSYNDYYNLRQLESRLRSRSRSYLDDDLDYYYQHEELARNRDLQDLLRMTDREEREASIFNLRQALENPIELPKKSPMRTTVGPGFYSNTLYGTEVWNPSEHTKWIM